MGIHTEHISWAAVMDELSFPVQDIPEEGLRTDVEVDSEALGLSVDDARIRGPISVSVALHTAGRHIDVRGRLTARFVDECVRCLKHSEREAGIPFAAQYRKPDAGSARARASRRESEQGGGQTTRPAEDEDSYAVTADRVDLAEMLREHIILSLPMQPLCSAGCLGLCPVCGRDRNEQDCGCREVPQKNPFSVLEERFKKDR